MYWVVEFRTSKLSTFESHWSCCLPCLSKGKDSSCAMFASITCHKNLVVAWSLMIDGCEAVLAKYKPFYGFEGMLVLWTPEGEIRIAFFLGQWHEDGGVFCKGRQECTYVVNQSKELTNLLCRYQCWPVRNLLYLAAIHFNAPLRNVMA